MEIEPMAYRQWPQAYRCRAGAAEMVVVADIGPRILDLRWKGGGNLLYEDTTGFGRKDWRLYGGHRLTVAPEGEESYLADNQPCVVTVRSGRLSLQTTGGASEIRRELVIMGPNDGAGFELLHVLTNDGKRPWRGAAWAITCVPHSELAAPCGRVRCWPGTERSDWTFARGGLAGAPRTRRGKIGWHSLNSWLAALQPQATLVIHHPDPAALEDCVDDGCNVEVFACPDYIELETLGSNAWISPGQSVIHRQRWRLLDPGLTPSDCPTIAARAGCFAPKLHAHER